MFEAPQVKIKEFGFKFSRNLVLVLFGAFVYSLYNFDKFLNNFDVSKALVYGCIVLVVVPIIIFSYRETHRRKTTLYKNGILGFSEKGKGPSFLTWEEAQDIRIFNAPPAKNLYFYDQNGYEVIKLDFTLIDFTLIDFIEFQKVIKNLLEPSHPFLMRLEEIKPLS